VRRFFGNVTSWPLLNPYVSGLAIEMKRTETDPTTPWRTLWLTDGPPNVDVQAGVLYFDLGAALLNRRSYPTPQPVRENPWD
jgi:hypothetical protein